MEVVVAGGHGKVALHLLRMLAQRGDRGRGLIRTPDHAADLEAVGADAVLCDLESNDDLAAAVRGADAVVFAAGAGPGSGAERKRTVDYGGAVKLIESARSEAVRRYVMVSAMGVPHPERWSEQMRPYYQAKADADAELAESGLDHTIVRPGGLTDGAGTGRVAAGEELERGEIPREDVAATIAAVLAEPGTIGRAFDIVSGTTPIDAAIRSL